MVKIHNFGAGPAKLPEEVYEIMRNELTDFEGSGISLLETSHRSATYMNFNKEIQNVVRRLLSVPDDYAVLFLAGGGQGQFAGVPLNLMGRTGSADYVVTGAWSAKAAKEAQKYGKVNLVVPAGGAHTDVPRQEEWTLDPNASYVHICTNETIHGVEFDFIPDTKGVPLVADMSSNFFSRKVDVSKFGVIYGGAQKNIGTSGVVLVIARRSLLGGALAACPAVLDWRQVHDADSILNTPPMFAVYVMGRVLQWIERSGGLPAMEAAAKEKSGVIYDVIDGSQGFYLAPVAVRARSRMNIPFRVQRAGQPDPDLEALFLRGAVENGLIQLKGHRMVGGIRASTYNAVTMEQVRALADYMTTFYNTHKQD